MNNPSTLAPLTLDLKRIDSYPRYLPTAFDDSLSILEKMNKIIYNLHQIGEATDEIIKNWNDLIEWIMKDGITAEVERILKEWLADGTLADIINKTLFGEFEVRLSRLEDEFNKFRDIFNKFNQEMSQIVNSVSKVSLSSASGIHQRLVMKPYFGTETEQIFDGAERAPQGLAYVEFEGKKYVFVLSKISGTTWREDEMHRITQFELDEKGNAYQLPLAFTRPLKLGHQGLSAIVENGKIWLFAGYGYGDDLDNGKGYSKIEWKGTNTKECDISRYRVLGLTGTQEQYSFLNHATPTVSTSGELIAFTCATTFATNQRYSIIFDRREVERAPDSMKVPCLNQFTINAPEFIDSHIAQDIACDDNYVYFYSSGVAPLLAKTITIYNVQGYRIGDYQIDGSLGEYPSKASLKNDPRYGDATQMEAEGLTIAGSDLLILSTDVWEKDGRYTKRDKMIHRIHSGSQCKNDKPINAGLQPLRSPAPIHIKGTTMDITYPVGDTLQFGTYNEVSNELKNSFSYWGAHHLRLYDAREGSNNKKFGYIGVSKTSDRSFMELRARNDDRLNDSGTQGGGINLYGNDDSGTPMVLMYSQSSDLSITYNARLQETGAWRPGVDGNQTLGTPSYRWKTLYATTSSINTSDKRYKDHIMTIPDSVLDAWGEVEYQQFKYKQSMREKGSENARIHIGVMAQEIIEAFNRHDLDAFDYGLVTYTEWDAEEERVDNNIVVSEARPKGSIYGIRASECLFLESALLRREITRLKEGK